jgi:hypothetical protein
MSCRLKVGDAVRVCHAPGSPWQASLGTVVEIFDREGGLQECAVRIDGNLRWFMAEHLGKTVSPKWLRFYRNEVMERWRLSPDETCNLNGDRDQLVELLRDHCAFSIRRAEVEVDDFYVKFDESARVSTSQNYASLSAVC